MTWRILVACVALCALLTAASCGGSSGDTQDNDDLRLTVEGFLQAVLNGDTNALGEYVSDSCSEKRDFIDEAEQLAGLEPVNLQVPEGAFDFDVDDDYAVVRKTSDGPAILVDGEAGDDDATNDVPLELAKEDDRWRVVNCEAFVFRLPDATATPARTATPRSQRTPATVVRVIDGDTIEIEGGQRVRYIGMDTPEATTELECFGREATWRNVQLVQGREVELEKDVSETDRFDRLLRYVWLDGQLVNELLVEEGFAVVSTYPPDVKHQDRLSDAERDARAANAGLWSECGGADVPLEPTVAPATNRRNCDAIRGTQYLSEEERVWFQANCVPSMPPPVQPTQPAQQPVAPPAPPSGNCDPSYPTVCIPPYPPDLNCPEVPFDDFTVLPPDPHGFDGDNDGVGCES